MDYKDEFNRAIQRSKEWNLDVPEVSFSSTPVLSGEKSKKALTVMQSEASKHTAADISQQCFGYMYFMKGILEKALQAPLYYTLGYINYNYSPVFHSTEDELKSLIGKSMAIFSPINLHAWLTTPNLEIIDLTFGTTYGVVMNNPHTIGLCAFQHYSEFDDRMVYHPQFVGEDYLRKIGAFLEFGLFIV